MEHPEMTIIAGFETGFAGLGDMVSQSVAAAQTSYIAYSTFAVPCPVIVVYQLYSIGFVFKK